jgi:hypothetical protein
MPPADDPTGLPSLVHALLILVAESPGAQVSEDEVPDHLAGALRHCFAASPPLLRPAPGPIGYWPALLRLTLAGQSTLRGPATRAEEGADWLTVAQVCYGFAWFTGRGKAQQVFSNRVTRLVARGKLRDNGKKGRDRRIDLVSVLEYSEATGEVWNEEVAGEDQ